MDHRPKVYSPALDLRSKIYSPALDLRSKIAHYLFPDPTAILEID